jgi:hypothetical protein
MTTDTTAGRGHPRHQLRRFTVRVRNRHSDRSEQVTATAQVVSDAILRAGLTLAERHPGTELADWTVAGVRDPAPFTWIPGEDVTT